MAKTIFSLCLIACLLLPQLSCGVFSSRNGGAKAAPHFKPGWNLFTTAQDVELGKQSAQQVERQVPLLNDAAVTGYVQQLGKKLAAKAPGYKFPFEFHVVATKDINAFALPGGFVFVNAGAIMAAKDEGELAGVMAHEISHVVLRHGTNQASKAYLAKAGLDVLSTITGGDSTDLGHVINVIGGAGANAVFLKFSRGAESEADLEGAQIMAAAGYDPREMANFFKTLEQKGGQRVPEFLSDHPDPGNRMEAIAAEIPALHVSPSPVRDTKEFEQVKAKLTSGRTALRAAADPSRVGPNDPNHNKPGSRPEPPAASFKEFHARDGSYGLAYPRNWDDLVADDSNVILAPKGAYGKLNDSLVVTHGVFLGLVKPEGKDLQSATNAFVAAQAKVNADFRIQRKPEEIDLGGRTGYATIMSGPSPVTGVEEIDVIYTSIAPDGRLFYLITMAPVDELQSYKPTFEHIISSIRFAK